MTQAANLASLGAPMIADTSGNVGVGTATPTGKLNVVQNATPIIGQFDRTDAGTGLVIAADSSGPYFRPTTSSAIRWNNSANTQEYMRIDSSGRITQPYQPMFAANASGFAGIINTGSYVPYGNVITNVGSAYNASTYKFTVPIAGTYLFQMNIYSNGATNGSVRLIRNDTNNSAYGPYMQLANGTTNYPSYGCGVIEALSAGDTIGVKCTYQSAYSDGDCWFSGYLLG
jgi:hypothetical protein